MTADPTQCYEVKVALFGPYPHGSVVPGFLVAANGHDPAKLVEQGALAPTAKPCNVAIVPPPAAAVADGTAELFRERNDLVVELKQARQDAAHLRMQVAEKDAGLKVRDAALAAHLDELAHLKTACEAHQGRAEAAERRAAECEQAAALGAARAADLEARVKALTADLDAATRPADPKPADPKKPKDKAAA